ncbi:MAG: hypothetical protein ACR2IK_03255 [Chloroflexota bacterium]
MQLLRPVLVHYGWPLILLAACQSAAPAAPAPEAAGRTATVSGTTVPISAPALGIDLRVPPTRAPRASPLPAAPTVGVSVTVTLVDDGRTLSLQTGQRALISLGDDFDWIVQVEDASILSCVTGVTVVAGAQGLYQANRIGRTMLTASGDPICRKAQPACALPSRTMSASIVVQ